MFTANVSCKLVVTDLECLGRYGPYGKAMGGTFEWGSSVAGAKFLGFTYVL